MKKILPYILVLVIFIGLFSPVIGIEKARAEDPPLGTCTVTVKHPDGTTDTGNVTTTETECTAAAAAPPSEGEIVTTRWVANPPASEGTPAATSGETKPPTEFQKEIDKKICGIGILGSKGSIYPGCVIQVFYALFYYVPALFLFYTAYFFNVIISVTINGDLLKDPFVYTAWSVVRDLSNIFFILVLLYVAVQMILGMAHDAKKMIVKVLIVALLINFSMFFTQVVIDTSNVLALVFYDKLQVREHGYAKVGTEKDVAGGMVLAFDPTTPLSQKFFEESKKIYDIDGKLRKTEKDVPAGTLIALILISGLLMGFAIYALFISAFSFLGRLIELWILIIFSPFAFMSSTIHQLENVEYLGWNKWFERLLSTAFMAPVFMFFLYFIFLLIKSDLLKGIVAKQEAGEGAAGTMIMLLGVVLPIMLIMILLLKATDFAKKGSGKFGEALTKFAGTVGGMTVGAAGIVGGTALFGGAAALGRASAGRIGAGLANSGFTRRLEGSKYLGWAGGAIRKTGAAVGSSSFDARGISIGGKSLSSVTGLNLGKAGSDGFVEKRAKQEEKRVKRMEELKVGKDEALMQPLNRAEEDLEKMKNVTGHAIHQIDVKINALTDKILTARTTFESLQTRPYSDPARQKALGEWQELAGKQSTYRADRKALKGIKADSKTDDGRTMEQAAADAELAAAANPSDHNLKDAAHTARLKATIAATSKTLHNSTPENGGVSMDDLEDDIIPEAEHHIEQEENRRRENFAAATMGKTGRVLKTIFSLGQHSWKGDRVAAHAIRTKASSSGHGSSKKSHTPAAPKAAPAPKAAHAEPAHAESAHDAPASGGH